MQENPLKTSKLETHWRNTLHVPKTSPLKSIKTSCNERTHLPTCSLENKGETSWSKVQLAGNSKKNCINLKLRGRRRSKWPWISKWEAFSGTCKEKKEEKAGTLVGWFLNSTVALSGDENGNERKQGDLT